MLLTRGLKFRPGDPLHVKTFEDMADEEVPTFFIEMVREYIYINFKREGSRIGTGRARGQREQMSERFVLSL